MWYAKPRGPYSITSTEGTANIWEFYHFFQPHGYSVEAISGMLGNVASESALNPWRWQSDKVNVKMGYGLFGYTPASKYLDNAKSLPGYGPSYSTTSVSPGARPEDANAQLLYFVNTLSSSWNSKLWRSYWDAGTYPELHAKSLRIIDTWGSGGRLSPALFPSIKNVPDATFAFLAGYEGPAIPNYDIRAQRAAQVYAILTGGPIPPDPPVPPRGNVPPWLLFKFSKGR